MIHIQPMLLIPLLGTCMCLFCCVGVSFLYTSQLSDCVRWLLVYLGGSQRCRAASISVSLMFFLRQLFSEFPTVILFHILGKPVKHRDYFSESKHEELNDLVRCKECNTVPFRG